MVDDTSVIIKARDIPYCTILFKAFIFFAPKNMPTSVVIPPAMAKMGRKMSISNRPATWYAATV